MANICGIADRESGLFKRIFEPPPIHEKRSDRSAYPPYRPRQTRRRLWSPLRAHIFSEKNKPSKNICRIFSLGRLFTGCSERQRHAKSPLRGFLECLIEVVC